MTLRIRNALGACFNARGSGSLSPLLPYFTANIASLDKRAAARLTYTAGIITLFLLLDRSVVESFTILGIQFNNIANLKIFLPPLTCFFAFSCLSNQLNRRLQEEAIVVLIEKEYNDLWKADLEAYIIPSHLMQTLLLLTIEVEGWPKSVGTLMRNSTAAILILAIPTFYLYAFYKIFEEFGTKDPLVWLSFVGSTIIIFYFAAMMWLFNRATLTGDRRSA